MEFVIMDLEWNGAWAGRERRYFNEIIEVGAVRLNERLELMEEFSAVICPKISVKLSGIVSGLTNISQQELADGEDFTLVMSRFADFVGEDALVMTWSDTDLRVLLENITYFWGETSIDFLRKYADLQRYCQSRMSLADSNQIGLLNAANQIGLEVNEQDLHRALDDSRLSARVFQKLYNRAALMPFIRDAEGQEFYDRLLFKSRILSDLDNPLIQPRELTFYCPECGEKLRRTNRWSFRSRYFRAEHRCAGCKKKYCARVQFKLEYDGVVTRRVLSEKEPEALEASPPRQEAVPEA